MTNSHHRALIIGAGIGGLSAAIALRRAGMDVAIFEQAEEMREIGAGLQVLSGAMKVLELWGLSDQMRAAGTVTEHMEYRTAQGKPLFAFPVGEIGRRIGAPSVCVRRSEVQRILLSAVDEALHLGCRCVGFQQDDEGVTARFVDGREERGTILIGADGIRSAVRAQLLGDEKPRFAGYTCWRGLAPVRPADLPPGQWRMFWGRGARFGMAHAGEERLYWFSLVSAPEGGSDPLGGRKGVVARRFAGFAPPVQEVIDGTEEAAILRNDIYDREPSARWGTGRVTLLGDAAHATTPNQGQGGCLAIEDAAALAGALMAARAPGANTTTESALRTYEERRMPYTAAITTLSWRVGQISQVQNPIGAMARDLIVQAIPDRYILKWLQSPARLNQPPPGPPGGSRPTP